VSDQEKEIDFAKSPSRRIFLGAGSAALATAAFVGLAANAQQREDTRKAERDRSSSDPGQENRPLLRENPNSNTPPPTDHGDIGPIWYSFDLARKRMEGGWTHQVTQRELPSSKDITGVNMRLTRGSFRELHWHTADEWAFMLYGNARVTVLNPDGTMFVDDVSKGDLWHFPAGFPHSIQGLGPDDGCEFLLVFDEGMFSEDNTFLISAWLAHTPPEMLAKNSNLNRPAVAKLPTSELYIFPAALPRSLAEDKAKVGTRSEGSPIQYTFKMEAMAPTKKTAGGEVRIVDSRNFPVSKNIASALVTVKPGGMRELHWHPNASEWQFYIAGKGCMTVFMPPENARTMDFNANDVGFIPPVAGHYIENTGDTDLVFLEMFKAPQYMDFSMNNWIRRLPPEMVTSHLTSMRRRSERFPPKTRR